MRLHEALAAMLEAGPEAKVRRGAGGKTIRRSVTADEKSQHPYRNDDGTKFDAGVEDNTANDWEVVGAEPVEAKV